MTTLKTFTIAALVAAALLLLCAVLDGTTDTEADRDTATDLHEAIAQAQQQDRVDRAEAAIKRELARRKARAYQGAQP